MVFFENFELLKFVVKRTRLKSHSSPSCCAMYKKMSIRKKLFKSELTTSEIVLVFLETLYYTLNDYSENLRCWVLLDISFLILQREDKSIQREAKYVFFNIYISVIFVLVLPI